MTSNTTAEYGIAFEIIHKNIVLDTPANNLLSKLCTTIIIQWCNTDSEISIATLDHHIKINCRACITREHKIIGNVIVENAKYFKHFSSNFFFQYIFYAQHKNNFS